MNENDKQVLINGLTKHETETTASCVGLMNGESKQAEPVAQPYAHIYEFDSAVFGTYRSFSPSQWNWMKPTRTVAVYTHPAQPLGNAELEQIWKTKFELQFGVSRTLFMAIAREVMHSTIGGLKSDD